MPLQQAVDECLMITSPDTDFTYCKKIVRVCWNHSSSRMRICETLKYFLVVPQMRIQNYAKS